MPGMVIVLAALFLAVPITEIYVIVQVSHEFGFANTLGVLVLVSVLGGWLMKQQGMAVLHRVQAQLARGHVPGRELVDGLLILVAGALMLTPGFVTDLVGLLLLAPPTRAVLRGALIRRFRGRVSVFGGGGQARIIDVPTTEEP